MYLADSDLVKNSFFLIIFIFNFDSLYKISDAFTILGLWVLELAVSHIKESNCKLMSKKLRTLFLMTSLQYYCILGLAEIKTLHPREKNMRKRCRMRRSQNHCKMLLSYILINLFHIIQPQNDV